MEFFEAIERRRSTRKFTTEAVPAEVIDRAIDAALVAPNSSNMQPWEFYWVKTTGKKDALVKACFSQGAAVTAQELIVAVSRIDTWRRSRDWIVESLSKIPGVPEMAIKYYKTVVPLSYLQDPFGVLAVFKKVIFSVVGLFRAVPRGPATRAELFEVVTKTTALACENLMLAVAAQGYASCPMEGFDEARVKKILKLSRNCHVVMVVGVGRAAPDGVYGAQMRVDRSWVVKQV